MQVGSIQKLYFLCKSTSKDVGRITKVITRQQLQQTWTIQPHSNFMIYGTTSSALAATSAILGPSNWASWLCISSPLLCGWGSSTLSCGCEVPYHVLHYVRRHSKDMPVMSPWLHLRPSSSLPWTGISKWKVASTSGALKMRFCRTGSTSSATAAPAISGSGSLFLATGWRCIWDPSLWTSKWWLSPSG